MVRGLYTAYTGMINQQKRLDTVTNNLANASTTGFKREGRQRHYPPLPPHNLLFKTTLDLAFCFISIVCPRRCG